MDAEILRSITLFSSRNQAEREHLAGEMQLVVYAAGEILFKEGDIGDCFYIVLAGELEIIQRLGSAEERLLRVVGHDDYVGEMSLFDAQRQRSATVRALTDTQTIALTHAEFDIMLHDHPDFAYQILRRMSLHLHAQDIAIITELQEKNAALAQAYQELKDAQSQLIEKERMERELEVARQIQASILPRTPPRVPGFDLGFCILPARAVGGDFFDFIPLSAYTVGVVVGDVSDKGVPAAIYMALTRSLVREKARPATLPGRMLMQVNQQLLAMSDSDMFVTVLYGILDCRTGQFMYARAGHEVPLLFDANGVPVHVPHAPGQALGLFDALVLDEQVLQIPPGGLLVLNSDGASDALNPQEQTFGIAALEQSVALVHQQSAKAICDTLLRNIQDHQANARQFDDITLMAIRAM